jgi:outer membrane protein TolC
MVLLTLLLGAAQAETSLGYQEALDRALARNPELLMVEEDRNSAEGAMLAARGVFDPTFNGSETFSAQRSEDVQQFGEVFSDVRFNRWSAGLGWFAPTGTTANLEYSNTWSQVEFDLRDFGAGVQEQDPFFRTRLGLTVTQSLLQGHKLAFNLSGVRQARQAVSAAEAQVLQQRQQTLSNTAVAYWATYYQQQLLDIANKAVDVSTEERRVVGLKVEQGTLAPVEATRAEAALVQARKARMDAEQALRTAQDNLSLVIGERPGTAFVLSTAPAEPIALDLDDERAVAEALANNPGLRALRLQEENAAYDLTNARHQRLPQLDAVGTFALNGTEGSQGDATAELFSGDLPEWSLGATLSVPLGNRADRGNVQMKAASSERVRIQRVALERTIAQQVRTAVATIETARAQVDLGEANLRLAEQTLDAERALLEAGRTLQKDVLEAIRAVDTARADLQKAGADYQLAIIELERLKGSL